ncbi:MAG TPA: DinB family protein [Bryobacteraceae bacterium]|nr:DinB family protein [Bryobacteraceae bacterium]
MSTSLSLQTRVENIAEIESLRRSARIVHHIVRINVEGLTQAESLVQPRPAGNCLNWVVGHLLCVYENVLQMVGQTPVMHQDALKRYDRGSPPIQDPIEAMELSKLMAAWDESSQRIDAGLARLTSQTLDAPAPFSPTDDPNETVRSLLTTIFFHQAYHAGQTGILRRMAGKEGAMR